MSCRSVVKHRSSALWALTVFGCLASIGCGGPTAQEYDSSLPGKLDDPVTRISSAADVPDSTEWDPLFVAGSAPENRKDYAQFSFQVDAGTATESGDSATAMVIVETNEPEEVIGKVEWTFSKAPGGEDAWLIKTCPLPPGAPKAP